MATVTAMQTDSPVRQNWILGSGLDLLLIIGAPVLGVLFTVFLFQQAGMGEVLLAISIYNIAHHFPTFVRIYGDTRLHEVIARIPLIRMACYRADRRCCPQTPGG